MGEKDRSRCFGELNIQEHIIRSASVRGDEYIHYNNVLIKAVVSTNVMHVSFCRVQNSSGGFIQRYKFRKHHLIMYEMRLATKSSSYFYLKFSTTELVYKINKLCYQNIYLHETTYFIVEFPLVKKRLHNLHWKLARRVLFFGLNKGFSGYRGVFRNEL